MIKFINPNDDADPSLESSTGKEVENAFFFNVCYGLQTVARENKPKSLHNNILFSLLSNVNIKKLKKSLQVLFQWLARWISFIFIKNKKS